MNWELIIAASALVFSVLTYVHNRRVELAWRRTEFLFAQAQFLDTDPELREALMILDERHVELTVPDIYDSDSELDVARRDQYLQRMDSLWNFLWRICYAYLVTKTIGKKELEAFGWYFCRIADYPSLLSYCRDNGFNEIVIVIEELCT